VGAQRPLDAFLQALGFSKRDRLTGVSPNAQLVANLEWGSEFLTEPTFDSAFMFGSQAPVGLVAARPAAVLGQFAPPAAYDGKMKGCWFWYSIQRVTTASRVIMVVDSPALYPFAQVGVNSIHAFNPGVPGPAGAIRSLFGGNTTAVITSPQGGLAHSSSAAGVSTATQIWHGPFWCPSNLIVWWTGDTVGVGENFLISVVWRELPSQRVPA